MKIHVDWGFSILNNLGNTIFVYQSSEICKSLIELLRFSFSIKYSIDYFSSHDATSVSCFEDTRPLKSLMHWCSYWLIRWKYLCSNPTCLDHLMRHRGPCPNFCKIFFCQDLLSNWLMKLIFIIFAGFTAPWRVNTWLCSWSGPSFTVCFYSTCSCCQLILCNIWHCCKRKKFAK